MARSDSDATIGAGDSQTRTCNPLNLRFPRELRNNLGKYLGLFLLLTIAIAMVSGFLGAASSIERISSGMREAYVVEDFSFTTSFEASDEALAAVEDLGARVYENYYADVSLELPGTVDAGVADDVGAAGDAGAAGESGASDNADTAGEADTGIVARLYQNRTREFDAAIYCEGRAPQGPGEIALDRVFCQNHDLAVGDRLTLAGEEFELVGIMTLADYTSLFESPTDFMFNAVTFTVAQVTADDLDRLGAGTLTYKYSVVMDDRAADPAARIDFETEAVEALADNGATVIDLVDCEANGALTFAPSDVSGDQRMWEILMVMLIVIMGFVFVVLTDATIEGESAVIGTLLASGWRKRELIAHYLTLPVIIGIVGAALGNLLGYTLMTAPMQGLYYGSYSFPPYQGFWSWRVFLITTVVPFVLLIGITWLGLLRRMHATPLQFLRHEASAKARRGGARLPERLSFPARFRIRVFLRNASHFATLFFGIMFGSILLLIGLCLMPIVDECAALMMENVPAEHVYMLKAELAIDATPEERDAWAAVEELREDPVLAGIDLDVLQDLSDAADAAGLDLASIDSDKLSRVFDSSDSQDVDTSQTVDDMTDQDVKRLVMQMRLFLGIDLTDATPDQVRDLLRAAQAMGDELSGLSDEDVEHLMDLLQRMSAAPDLEAPANQTPIDDATLAQVEKFAAGTVEVERRHGGGKEKVTVYGIAPDSRYWTGIDVSGGRVVVGSGLVEKCVVKVGEPLQVENRYKGQTYTVTPSEVVGNGTLMDIYLDIDSFNELFGEDQGSFGGYLSSVELPLDARYVAAELTPTDMLKMSDQMRSSMGEIAFMMAAIAVPIYLLLIYLLTKTVIDRSARAISYMKVFGYHTREINKLYLRSITITVLASLIGCIPIILKVVDLFMMFAMARFSGNFVINIPPALLAVIVGVGFATYLVVAAIHVRHIRRIGLAEALKVQE